MFGLALWQALCFAAFWSCLTRNISCARASLGLLANWCILTQYATLSGDQFNWVVNAMVDYVTVIVALVPLRSVGGATLVATYALGMVFHALLGARIVDHYGFGVLPVYSLQNDRYFHSDLVKYWYRFHYLAWFQAAVMLTWAGGISGLDIMRWNIDRTRRKSMGSGVVMVHPVVD